MTITVFRALDVADADKPKPAKCGGLFFRYVAESWVGVTEQDINYRHRFRFLKKQSCSIENCANCEYLWDEAAEACNDLHQYRCLDGISDNKVVGRIYQLKITGTSVDWETGYVDDIDVGFVEAIERPSEANPCGEVVITKSQTCTLTPLELTHEEISRKVRRAGYECTMVEGEPYLRYDFYSVEHMSEAQDYYYIIVEELEAEGLEFDDPYIEHDCITGTIKEIPRTDDRHKDHPNNHRNS